MHRRIHRNVVVLALLVMALLALPNCATNSAPETNIISGGATVLEAATMLQRGITAQTDAGTLNVELAQRMTDTVDQIYQKSTPLGEALKAYHAATNLDVKKLQAANIQKMVADVNSLVATLLGNPIPEGSLKQVSLLIGNLIASVGAVQAEIARGLGQ